MTKTTKSWLTDLTLLIVFTSLLYGLFLGMRPLIPPDEGRYSEIPREMVQNYDYLTPRLDGVAYFEKPILFYWLQAASINIFGLHEWSFRLVNALMGGLGVLLTYAVSRRLYNRRIALLAGALLSTSLLYAFLSRYITLDITLTFFLSGSLLLFILGNEYPAGSARRLCMWGMYSFAALATLTKGLIGIVFPGMIIFSWLLLTQQWQRLQSYCLFSGTLLFLLITVPWHVLVGLKNPGFFQFYFYEQHFLRYFTHYAGREQTFWFLPLVLLAGWFPWTGFVLSALKRSMVALRFPKQQSKTIFFLLWTGLIFVFYWLSHSQLAPYLLPLFPPLAIITAQFFDEHWQYKNKVLRNNFSAVLVFSLLMVFALLFITPTLHFVIPKKVKVIVAIMTVLNGVACNLVYRYTNFKNALLTLIITNTLFSLSVFYASSFYTRPSVKPLALELKKVIQSQDEVYHYNHYFQDMPVYLEREVILLNWKGELEFGSKHNPPAGRFQHENNLWNNWQSNQRKFLVIAIKDFNEVKSILTDLKFYPLAQTQKYVVVCNKDLTKSVKIGK